jgi:hypothetical protein
VHHWVCNTKPCQQQCSHCSLHLLRPCHVSMPCISWPTGEALGSMHGVLFAALPAAYMSGACHLSPGCMLGLFAALMLHSLGATCK